MSYVALLRGINVGGHKKIAMRDLCLLFETLGFKQVKSILQTGNIVFEATSHMSETHLEKQIGSAIEHQLQLETAVLVRRKESLVEIIRNNPFSEMAVSDPSHLLVLFVDANPSSSALEALIKSIQGREQIIGGHQCLYLAYPDGIGRSKLTHQLIEKKLGLQGTARNWTTLAKIKASMP
ncbi:DUF1697 domain-containing protein [Legionella sp. PATHC035]|uniref:DUF1697 domain-containing protein n=1 Tax=Legionella sp. PATHC035 TaxID=2992040 RepID=UPI002243E4AC|nr:DUF1697 domain-containing protein [Legionella sp. PATHC035]MCW8409583.1 DUF1697 domain-containing protein [Legionella sp. PATHC035]